MQPQTLARDAGFLNACRKDEEDCSCPSAYDELDHTIVATAAGPDLRMVVSLQDRVLSCFGAD